MLTTKQKAYLKGLANHLPNQFQIGKEGVSDNLLKGIDDFLRVHELIKINVLKTSKHSLDEVINELVTKLNCELIQKIGRIIIIYRQNKENPVIDLRGVSK
ncbi:TPA: ribosome assembly RNA-binding protein YhbY [bacterium]|jgi:RNA-binding protein|nr:ribosome assembly RNA-binding protein YhbY [bacterium]